MKTKSYPNALVKYRHDEDRKLTREVYNFGQIKVPAKISKIELNDPITPETKQQQSVEIKMSVSQLTLPEDILQFGEYSPQRTV
jgi:hypothetical protein